MRAGGLPVCPLDYLLPRPVRRKTRPCGCTLSHLFSPEAMFPPCGPWGGGLCHLAGPRGELRFYPELGAVMRDPGGDGVAAPPSPVLAVNGRTAASWMGRRVEPPVLHQRGPSFGCRPLEVRLYAGGSAASCQELLDSKNYGWTTPPGPLWLASGPSGAHGVALSPPGGPLVTGHEFGKYAAPLTTRGKAL